MRAMFPVPVIEQDRQRLIVRGGHGFSSIINHKAAVRIFRIVAGEEVFHQFPQFRVHLVRFSGDVLRGKLDLFRQLL